MLCLCPGPYHTPHPAFALGPIGGRQPPSVYTIIDPGGIGAAVVVVWVTGLVGVQMQGVLAHILVCMRPFCIPMRDFFLCDLRGLPSVSAAAASA